MNKFANGLLVCIGFGDYLATTLPLNRPLFEKFVVVTSAEDKLTHKVCKAMDVDLVVTERHLPGFNKGKAINDGLDRLEGWVCHIDADIVVPHDFHSRLPLLSKKIAAIYGCHRWLCQSPEDWYEQRKDKWIENRRTRQTVPVGYFQLWHTSTGHRYPEDVPLARSTDWRFSKQFRIKRNLDWFVIHLSTNEWVRGRDDEGRVTRPWPLVRF